MTMHAFHKTLTKLLSKRLRKALQERTYPVEVFSGDSGGMDALRSLGLRQFAADVANGVNCRPDLWVVRGEGDRELVGIEIGSTRIDRWQTNVLKIVHVSYGGAVGLYGMTGDLFELELVRSVRNLVWLECMLRTEALEDAAEEARSCGQLLPGSPRHA